MQQIAARGKPAAKAVIAVARHSTQDNGRVQVRHQRRHPPPRECVRNPKDDLKFVLRQDRDAKV
jgi:hypothetical protein